MNNLIFKSSIKDNETITMSYEQDEKRKKCRMKHISDESIERLNAISEAVEGRWLDIAYIVGLSKVGLWDGECEANLYSKIIASSGENEEKKPFDKYVLIGDTGSGKSYLLSSILANELKSLNISFKELEKILSGNGETTRSEVSYKFISVKNKNDEEIILEYRKITDYEIEGCVIEILMEAYNKINNKKRRHQEIKNILPKQAMQSTFRLKDLFDSKEIENLEKPLIDSYNFIDATSKSESSFIDMNKAKFIKLINEKVELKKELIDKYKKGSLNKENFKYVLNMVNKEFSIIRSVTVNIKKVCSKEFIITDSIGLNHGENQGNITEIRLKRLSEIMSENLDSNILFIIDGTKTTELTLEPIALMEKYGKMKNTMFIVSKLDLLRDKYDNISDFIEEKIVETGYLDDVLSDFIMDNSISSASIERDKNLIDISIDKISELLNNKLGVKREISIDISSHDDLYIEYSIKEFLEYVNLHFRNIHWATMQSYISNLLRGSDRHEDRHSNIYSISVTLKDIVLKNININYLNGILIKSYKEVLGECDDVILEQLKQEFWINFEKLAYYYFIRKNIKEIKIINNIRINKELRIYHNISMTQERTKRFLSLILINDIELKNILNSFIKISIDLVIKKRLV